MKKFTKVSLIICGVCSVLGIACLLSSLAMGLTRQEIATAMQQGEFSIIGDDFMFWGWHDDYEDDYEYAYDSYSDYVEEEAEESYRYSQDEVEKLDINVNMAGFYLEESTDEYIYVKVFNEYKKKKDIVRLEGKELKVDYKGINNGHEVVVCIPAGTHLGEIDIDVEKGNAVMASELSADSIEIDVGAGEFISDALITGNELNLNVGAGVAIIARADAKKIELECGMGSLDITAVGTPGDYRVDMEVGMGSMQVGDNNYPEPGSKQILNPDQNERKISAECGMGSLNIYFGA